MTFSLQMTNLFIGMCRGVSSLPDPLFRLGFQDGPVELEFSLDAGGVVKPELILESESLGHCILCEWKSGKNVETAQAKRYSRVSAKALTERALLASKVCVSHDVLYVGESIHSETLRLGLSNAGTPFPLLVKTEGGLELVANNFSNAGLHEALSAPLTLDWDQVPTLFVPLDTCSEDWEIAEVLFPKIWERMTRREKVIEVSLLVPAVFEAWSNIAVPEQNSIRERVTKVLRDAAKYEFKDHFSFEKGTSIKPGDKVVVKRNPFRHGATNVREMKKLRDLQASFVRLKREKEVRQLDLFGNEE